ncbi:uncharacterized protein LOC106665283 [Cimex lectularius]|uniref:Odorant binding protein n=2 Tax=Cimex lectularius TaxID=79782 RepID=A0A8I6RIS1_CIMLE|nr:uncharacterized protein LOC106665283 [Cimex lectularius]
MKALLVFAVLVATSYAAEQEVLSLEYSKAVLGELRKCKAQFPSITEEDYRSLITDKKLPTTRDQECFAKCYATERGYYKGPGNLDLVKLKTNNAEKYKIPENLRTANEIDDVCVKKAKSVTDDCKTVTTFYVCRATTAREKGFKFAKYHPDATV